MRASVPLSAVGLSVLIHTLWGGNPIAAKFGLEVFPPAWSALIRFVIGILTVVIWCLWRKHPLWPSSSEWVPMVKISVLFTVQILLMNIGIDGTTGINSSILISTNPIFAALFAHYLLANDRLTWLRSLGLVLAFTGVCVTLIESGEGMSGIGNFGDWMCLFSSALLGLRLIVSVGTMEKIDPFKLTLWQMIFSLPVYLVYALLTETIDWQNFDYTTVLAMLYQGVVIAGLGFMVSLWLISRYQPSIMAGFNFLAPISGVILAALLLGETISLLVIAGTALVAVGMVMITVRSNP